MKATVIVSDRPLGEVLERLARVFGAEWVKADGKGEAEYRLQRTRAVEEWEKAWHRAREAAEREARAFQEREMLALLKEVFSKLDGPFPTDEQGRDVLPTYINDLWPARFVKSLRDSELQTVVRSIAESSAVRTGGVPAAKPFPLHIPVSRLTGTQRQYVRSWYAESLADSQQSDRLGAIQRNFNDSVVAVGSQGGTTIDVALIQPDGSLGLMGHAGGGHWAGDKLEEVVQKERMRRLGRSATPEGALLGASITREGTIAPEVRLDGGGETPLGAGKTLQRVEMLLSLADDRKLNVIADHHTRSTRLRARNTTTLAELAGDAAAQLESVVRYEGGYFLARNKLWPDRDMEETPYPYPERWISEKRAGRGLNLSDYAVIASLSEPRLDGLRAYVDGQLSLRPEVRGASENRWVLVLMKALTSQQKKRAESPEGLPLYRLTLRLRTFTENALAASVQPTPTLRLYHRPPPAKPRGDAIGAPGVIYFAEPGASVGAWMFAYYGARG